VARANSGTDNAASRRGFLEISMVDGPPIYELISQADQRLISSIVRHELTGDQ
jgi:hypothetical protein